MAKNTDKDAKKSNYTVKLDNEIKAEWEKLTDEISEEYGLKFKGEAYPILIELIRKKSDLKPTPEVKDYITAINSALELIQANLDCINKTFSTFKDQQEAQLESQTKDLRIELKETKEKLKKARATNMENYSIIKEANEKIKLLENENRQLREINDAQDTLRGFKNLYADYKERYSSLDEILNEFQKAVKEVKNTPEN